MTERYTKEQHDFIRSALQTKPGSQIVEEFNLLFERKITKEKLKSYKQNHNLRSAVHENEKPRLYTEEMVQWVRDHAEGVEGHELTRMMNDHFGTEFTYSQIHAMKKNKKITSGVITKYQKGHVPYSKGRKVKPETLEKLSRTFYKPGNIPDNYLPVGSIIVDSGGYRKIKIAEPKTWMRYSWYVWEQNHGPVPDGKMVMHIDGDKLNDSIDNLYLITREENAIFNSKEFKHVRTVETMDSIHAYAQLRLKLRKLQNERKNKEKPDP